jgi:hypothetical protein
MESVDRARMATAVFPALRERRAAGVPDEALRSAVAACAEGYPFPTNLDRDQPIDGLAPPTQAELLWRAVDEDWPPDALETALKGYAERHATGP